ncbi:hypothetical protein A2U01_0068211, partial [Trifolium medium]|nr:hypothetical protein [Trifolium medium]
MQQTETAEASYSNYVVGRAYDRAGRREQQRDTAGAVVITDGRHQFGMNNPIWTAPEQGTFKCNVDAAIFKDRNCYGA